MATKRIPETTNEVPTTDAAYQVKPTNADLGLPNEAPAVIDPTSNPKHAETPAFVSATPFPTVYPKRFVKAGQDERLVVDGNAENQAVTEGFTFVADLNTAPKFIEFDNTSLVALWRTVLSLAYDGTSTENRVRNATGVLQTLEGHMATLGYGPPIR